MPRNARRFGVIVFMLVFSLVGFDDCLLFGPQDEAKGLDGPTWRAVEVDHVPRVGNGWFIKGNLLHNLTLTFSDPFDGAVTAHGNFTLAPLPGSPEVSDQGGSFTYDGGSKVTLLFGNVKVTGSVTLEPLADDETESFRHGTIVIDQTVLGEPVHLLYRR